MMRSGRLLVALGCLALFLPLDRAQAADTDEIVIVHPATLTNRLLVGIINGFSARPLNMEIRRHGSTLIAQSGRRPPGLLTPFREQAYIVTSIDTQRNGANATTTLRILPLMYVSRYNSSSEDQWHMPTRFQETRYSEMIRKAVRDAARLVCPRSQWVGNQLTC